MKTWAGGFLASAGILAWAITLTIFEPAAHRGYESQNVGLDDADMTGMLMWVKDLRWAAIVLAVGGLLAVGLSRALAAGLALIWAAADIVLDRIGTQGWLAFAVVILIAGLAVAAGLRWIVQNRQNTDGQLIYSAAAGTVAFLIFEVEPVTRPFQPAGAMATAIAVGSLLVVAAVANAASGRAHVALALVALPLLGLSAAHAAGWVPRVSPLQQILLAALGSVVVLGICAWASEQPVSRLGLGLWLIPLAVLTFVCLYVGILVAYGFQPAIISLTGDKPYYDGYPMVLPGVLSGLILGAASGAVVWPQKRTDFAQ